MHINTVVIGGICWFAFAAWQRQQCHTVNRSLFFNNTQLTHPHACKHSNNTVIIIMHNNGNKPCCVLRHLLFPGDCVLLKKRERELHNLLCSRHLLFPEKRARWLHRLLFSGKKQRVQSTTNCAALCFSTTHNLLTHHTTQRKNNNTKTTVTHNNKRPFQRKSTTQHNKSFSFSFQLDRHTQQKKQ